MRRKILPDLVAVVLTFVIFYMSCIYVSEGLFILSIFIPAVYVTERLVLAIQKKRLKIRVSVSSRSVTVNQPVKVHIYLTNPSFFPVMRIKLKCNWIQADNTVSESVELFAPAHEQRECIVSFETKHCGKAEVSLEEAACLDWLGFFHVYEKLDFVPSRTVFIFPTETYEKQLEGKHKEMEETKEETFEQVKAVYSTDTAGVRGYIPGDSLHGIHWKMTAKTGVLQVKEYSSNRAAGCGIYVPVLPLLQAGAEERDERFSQLLSASLMYLKNGVVHSVCYDVMKQKIGQKDAVMQTEQIIVEKPEDIYVVLKDIYERMAQYDSDPDTAQLWQMADYSKQEQNLDSSEAFPYLYMV